MAMARVPQRRKSAKPRVPPGPRPGISISLSNDLVIERRIRERLKVRERQTAAPEPSGMAAERAFTKGGLS